MQIGESVRILDLLHSEHHGWCVDHIAQLFGPNLTKQVLSIAVPTYEANDMKVWRSSCK